MPKPIDFAGTVNPSLDHDVERLAYAGGSSTSALINEALQSHVADEQQLYAAVEEGRQAWRDNRWLDHSVVEAAVKRVTSFKP